MATTSPASDTDTRALRYSDTRIRGYLDTWIPRAHLLRALDTCAISVNVQFYVMANCR